MITLSKEKTVVGLDLEAGSVAATEVQQNGSTQVTGFGLMRLPAGLIREGEVTDGDALGAALKQLFAEHRLSKTVRLGIANQRVVVRTLRFPLIEKPSELEAAIRFQAEDQIPMPLEQAILDYEVVGHSTSEAGQTMMDVVVVAARRDMISGLVAAMRKAGLRPIGVDLSAFGMIRALASDSPVSADPQRAYEDRLESDERTELAVPALLYCNLGDVANLAIGRGRTCLFTRVSPFGIEGIAQRLAERRALTLDHARQWLLHVGLRTPLEEIDGDPAIVGAARESLAEGVAKLVDEIRLSLEYYAAQEGVVPVEGVVACGGGTTIPGLVERLEAELGMSVTARNPEALGHLDQPSAARLTLSYGLATEV